MTEGTDLRVSVPEMDCPSCATTVEDALDAIDGVEAIETRPVAGTVSVRYDPEETDPHAVTDAITGAGYEVHDVDRKAAERSEDRDPVWRSDRAIRTAISGALVLGGLAIAFLLPSIDATVLATLERTVSVSDLLFLLAVAIAGGTILREGMDSLRARSLDIDLLMSIAIVGALAASIGFGAGLYMEAALLASLFSTAELLERYSIDRARASLRELLALSPSEATVRREGTERTVPVDDVAIGDVVIVRSGEQIPVDGVVIAGDAAVDQAPITGESVPIDKIEDDEVYAGTINESGYLEIESTALARESTLARIITMVEKAEGATSPHTAFVDRFASLYTPIVVVLATLTAILPPLVMSGPTTVSLVGELAYTFPAGWDVWFLYGLTLLVLACPCAFVIATPVSVVSGITSAARNGVLIKGGAHLEAMGTVDAVAMDKTGTLTTGTLTVTDVVPLNGRTERDVLGCAAGIETRSEHPIGESIVEYASDLEIRIPEADSFDRISGMGIEATVEGTPHYAGKPAFFEELGFDLTHVHAATDGGTVTRKSRQLCERHDCHDLLESTIPDLQGAGKTVVLVGTDERLEGVIALADEVRPGARDAVARLHELGVDRIIMLTGDNQRTARRIGEEVGIDEQYAGVLPEEKGRTIAELRETYDGVAMVGDGVNDAPALASATVGIAMGAAGTDTAIETADIALMGDDLSRLPYLYELSRTGTRVIRQNVWASLGAKALLACGVPFGLVPVWAAVLVGDAGMTLGITGNAMRLSRIRAD